MPYFDVKKVSSPYLPDSIGARSINLMCALLKGISYNRLYSGPFHYTPAANPSNDRKVPQSPLEIIIQNVQNLDQDLKVGATDNTFDVTSKLVGANGALSRIKTDLEGGGYPDIRLETLFYTDPASLPNGPEKDGYLSVITHLEGVHNTGVPGGDQMYHFCVPFLTMRSPGHFPAPGTTARPKRAPSSTEVELFLSILGDMEMRELYDKRPNHNPLHRSAAKNALDCCILKEHRPRQDRPIWNSSSDDLTVFGTDGNNRHCAGVGVGCQSCGTTGGQPNHPDDWCNQYTQGDVIYCTLGSDYH
jgi:hypothetical protein